MFLLSCFLSEKEILLCIHYSEPPFFLISVWEHALVWYEYACDVPVRNELTERVLVPVCVPLTIVFGTENKYICGLPVIGVRLNQPWNAVRAKMVPALGRGDRTCSHPICPYKNKTRAGRQFIRTEFTYFEEIIISNSSNIQDKR